MFDCASQPTAIVDTFVDKHNLKTYKSKTSIGGVGGQINCTRSCSIVLGSRFSSFEIPIEADVVPQTSLTYFVPSQQMEIARQAAHTLKLADQSLSYKGVDLILGNAYYEACVLNSTTTINGIIFRNTNFGWTPTGPIPKLISSTCNTMTVSSCFATSTQEIQDDLQKFWESEEVQPIESTKKAEQILCEQHFENTITRCEKSGKFVVRLPLKGSPSLLGDSRSRAIRCLKYAERKSEPELRKMYVAFMKEYEELGHMSLIPESEIELKPNYYIPHHAVLRPSSTTTKLRVVFNASAPTIGGPSLNQLLMCGPKNQPDLFDQLILFRLHSVVFSADLEKMYRKILVDEADRDLQRIVWRSNPAEPIKEYRLNTITYGTVPASFIATKCLALVAESVREKSPEAATAIARCFYMDDLLYGAETLEAASQLQRIIHSILLEHGFLLRKYTSNSNELLNQLEPSLVERGELGIVHPDTSTLLLGLIWEPNSDVFRVKVSMQEATDFSAVTKRVVLSVISRIFDPLGFLSPVIVRFKLLLQKVWLEQIGWDDTVSGETAKSFRECVQEIGILEKMVIRRSYSKTLAPVVSRELIGFCDASLNAYAATVYMQTTDALGNVECYLACAKTKVAPISTKNNIHRLELRGALLLAELIVRVSENLNFEKSKIFVYSDSRVTLCWLAKPPNTWNIFVANRVCKIQDLLPYPHWQYVNTAMNPADLATRGITANQHINSELWLFGPDFLLNGSTVRDIEETSNNNDDLEPSILEQRRPVILQISSSKPQPSMFEISSSFFRLQSAVARNLRWREKIRNRDIVFRTDFPDAEELKKAFLALVRYAQNLSFPKEIELLESGKTVSRKSRLWFLKPLLDENGILRLTGRLRNAPVSIDKRRPMIMASNSPFVRLYARSIHEKYFHGDRAFVVAFLHSQFHFVGGIQALVKNIIRKCVVCIRYNARTQNQTMGQLPLERVTFSRPFTTIGADFAGPFMTKCVRHRSTIRFKSYLCLFVCFSTKAVHLEMTSGLETECLKAAFDRFFARRGLAESIYSDNGSTFVSTSSSFQTIRWKFSPPYGPHHGGLWESSIKSAKRLLLKVTKGHTLTFEEYATLFAKIEAVLNSRPLCKNGDNFLTPGHLLTGGTHLLLPPEEAEKASTTLVQRYHVVKSMLRDFWVSWSRDYLSQLNSQTKWLKEKLDLRIGDVVLATKPGEKPSDWPLAVVTQTAPDPQGHVRRVTIRLHGSEYDRPITRLVLLPVEHSL